VSAVEGWHLKREVNLSHLAATVSLAIGLISWGNKIDNRITSIEAQVNFQKEILDSQQVRTAQLFDQLSSRLQRIEDKLDRVIEREREN
jgi:uncharacterized coiled-coil protein SlyX